MSRLPTSLRQQSGKAAERQRYLARTKRIVLARSGGACASCGARNVPLEDHHIVGRGHLVGRPWCDLPELRAALCVPCHRRVTQRGDKELLLAGLFGMWEFVERQGLAWESPLAEHRPSRAEDPLGEIRRMVDLLEAEDVEP